jgi:hypothetical protein
LITTRGLLAALEHRAEGAERRAAKLMRLRARTRPDMTDSLSCDGTWGVCGCRPRTGPFAGLQRHTPGGHSSACALRDVAARCALQQAAGQLFSVRVAAGRCCVINPQLPTWLRCLQTPCQPRANRTGRQAGARRTAHTLVATRAARPAWCLITATLMGLCVTTQQQSMAPQAPRSLDDQQWAAWIARACVDGGARVWAVLAASCPPAHSITGMHHSL